MTQIASEDLAVLTGAFDAGSVGFISKMRPWARSSPWRGTSTGELVVQSDELVKPANYLSPSTGEQTQELNGRELDVLRLLATGPRLDDNGAEHFLSPHTVRNHVSILLLKLGAHSKLEATATAVHDGTIPPGQMG